MRLECNEGRRCRVDACRTSEFIGLLELAGWGGLATAGRGGIEDDPIVPIYRGVAVSFSGAVSKEAIMQVMFNNPDLYVVAYPAQNGLEVIDKRRGFGTFICDEAAERFTRELRDAIENGDGEDLGDFMEHFDALLTHPAVYH